MCNRSLGFIGGGRITRIILEGLKRANQLPDEIVVSDVNSDLLDKLNKAFPNIKMELNENKNAAKKDIVFIAVHPPVMKDLLSEIAPNLREEAIIISLAPKCSMAKLTEGLHRHKKIVRMIPNAASVIGAGYNPAAFSEALSGEEKEAVLSMLSVLGECPEVPEENLEAYAIISAMGPTYLWFQLYELQEIGKSFGLSEHASAEAVTKMALGAVRTMTESGLQPMAVMDLVPAKPIGNEENNIKNIYRSNLEGLYSKLKG